MAITPERWGQVEEIFHATLSRGESEHEAFLVHACAGDLPLRREVELLLARQGRGPEEVTDLTAQGAMWRICPYCVERR